MVMAPLSTTAETSHTALRLGKAARLRDYAGLIPFALLLLLAVFGPMLAPQSATDVVGTPSSAPSGDHWFGTDSNGFDVLSRTLTAFRLDIAIAIGVTLLATAVGIAIGSIAGMYGSKGGVLGAIAATLGRTIDLVQALPVMIGGLVIVSFFGRNSVVIALALALVLMPFQGRLMRTEVLRTRNDGFVTAARMSGESELRILLRHVIPNSCAPVLENASAIFGMGIIFCAGLGFLGVGIPLPTAEWGNMLADGAADAAVGRWWPALFPVIALAYSVWAASRVTTFISRRRRV
ncbi:ABC transporter permease [Gordonia amicalis]|uniref:ABC transporter permease n=1 Tax=Gordonia amicalis TaxID=89053 RepID=A0AAE4R4N4_9ACTN|nr:ABC transporter permease [Gordonia amicalis]MCZ0915242.1 ABC transporter permease [Gordonia amicalis]MCZ4578387.1 ABC transporter permease [Gordonia amicalis]MCZ4650892.1 ABC transporter permease [Gordonia amicalis]MDJ0452968.1 ABC transporter permease [Gordonia amicalis]MDV6307159.1 ABC transporter permease [Gordonia amicalis]